MIFRFLRRERELVVDVDQVVIDAALAGLAAAAARTVASLPDPVDVVAATSDVDHVALARIARARRAHPAGVGRAVNGPELVERTRRAQLVHIATYAPTPDGDVA